MTYDHEAVFSVGEAEHLKDTIKGAHTKNLFLKDKKNNYFLITVEDNALIDLKSIHHKIGASGRVSFGSPEKLDEFLGLYPGAVSIFGAINDKNGQVKIIIDEPLFTQPLINGHPMSNDATMTISNQDLKRFIEATDHTLHVIKVSE
ncbi:prolyl-tRNA synthetase associated domain-containing protein [Bartonella sp. HY329]|uniref:prolyl-tRNA synthetase associated domain-containing protein n=1 Tax=unclassified Bartonella TaxID=2645622 RepID=UPI0021C6BD91|nr:MULTISPECIES: YbaK/EbsC family protein [unclassified Bartonella]UXM96410.1 prolyl-tRNA synthetase associated domain-containing protein [Bartonella sp. HY329]UXN10733.1 prolyl-tRNA synthetase associated domain-containing protein [Bartonella sp. HY328]